MSEVRSHPPGWSLVSLGDIGRLHCGQSPSVANVNRIGKGTPYVTGPDHWDGSTLTADKWTTDPRRVVPDGCIFITVKGAGVGTLFPGIACAIGRDVYAYEPGKGLAVKFVEHALRFQIGEVLRHAKGDIPGLSKDHILDHKMAIPSLQEQRRIVAKIEELFSDLDAGVAALERVRANLKRYRAAVLKAAVEGRLTEEWRTRHPATEPAARLLERILAERRAKWEQDQLRKFKEAGKTPPKGWKEKYEQPLAPSDVEAKPLPLAWCWATMEQLTTWGPQNGVYYPKSQYGRGTPIIRIDDYQNDSSRPASELQLVDAPAKDVETYGVRLGDIIINRVNSMTHLGKCLVIESKHLPAVFESNMMRQSLASDVVPTFVAHYLKSNVGNARLIANAKWAVNQASINQTDVGNTPVPLPPLAEQAEIVAEVDRRLSVADAAETQVEHALQRAARLRQAILKRAFEGKLVPQDPTDEPADRLVERLSARVGADTVTSTKALAEKRGRARVRA